MIQKRSAKLPDIVGMVVAITSTQVTLIQLRWLVLQDGVQQAIRPALKALAIRAAITTARVEVVCRVQHARGMTTWILSTLLVIRVHRVARSAVPPVRHLGEVMLLRTTAIQATTTALVAVLSAGQLVQPLTLELKELATILVRMVGR